MKPHAFVAMPFGSKAGADGQPIHFNRIYAELLKPALEDAGCDVFRADEEQRAGDIRSDMFQELLVADLVLADLTLDNPNVWYELGVRHALRARGVLLVHGPRSSNPFDIYTDRKLAYRLRDGAPDPATLAADRAALAAMARATLESSVRRKLSPVYTLLPHLQEPQWRELLLDDGNEFGAAYEEWRGLMEVARARQRAGDILVLADETPTQALWLEARRDAGNCLLQLRQFGFALEQFDAALAVAPDDATCRAKRVVCLGRLGRFEEAQEAARQFTADRPQDAEAWALSGRVEKDRWLACWCRPGLEPAALQQAAASDRAALEEAIAAYRRGFVIDPAHHYAGINALTLQLLLRHLGGEVAQNEIDALAGGVRWAVSSAQQRNAADHWARASAAALALLLQQPADSVQHAYGALAGAAKGDRFALDSSRQTLLLLQALGWRADATAAALLPIEREIARLAPAAEPRQVLLFSGHMVDTPGRATPRLPPSLLPAATAAIDAALDALGAGPDDLALTQGAAGGDLLFAEACLRRGVRLELLLPLPEPAFIEASILASAGGESWRARWFALQPQLTKRVMPDALGPQPPGVSAFERCNLWLLHTALALGPDKVRFVCLWDGGGGDGPGGTRHMHDEVKRRTGRVTWIDTRRL